MWLKVIACRKIVPARGRKHGRIFALKSEHLLTRFFPFNTLVQVDTFSPLTSISTKGRYIVEKRSPLPIFSVRKNHDQSEKRRSPYSILKIKTSATKDEIKAAFRHQAKIYHPDLNPNQKRSTEDNNTDADGGNDIMAEIIEAYNQLMNDDFASLVGDSRVRLACEIYSLEELKCDRLHDVHAIKILYDENSGGKCNDEITSNELSREALIEIQSHPDDSVSDLKRQLQNKYLYEWGLDGRRLDRDKLASGWELVVQGGGKGSTVLSYHLFLHAYGIQNNDVIHAVVRRYTD